MIAFPSAYTSSPSQSRMRESSQSIKIHSLCRTTSIQPSQSQLAAERFHLGSTGGLLLAVSQPAVKRTWQNGRPHLSISESSAYSVTVGRCPASREQRHGQRWKQNKAMPPFSKEPAPSWAFGGSFPSRLRRYPLPGPAAAESGRSGTAGILGTGDGRWALLGLMLVWI